MGETRKTGKGKGESGRMRENLLQGLQCSNVPAWGRAISHPEGLDHNGGPSAIPYGSNQSWILKGNLRDFFYKSRNIPDCCSIYVCGV